MLPKNWYKLVLVVCGFLVVLFLITTSIAAVKPSTKREEHLVLNTDRVGRWDSASRMQKPKVDFDQRNDIFFSAKLNEL